jgi:hypothetical protein
LTRAYVSGAPSSRTKTGSALRQPGLIFAARAGLMAMYGLMPRIAMTDVN